MAGRAARGGPLFVINICKLLVVEGNVLDDGGLDQPADGVVVAEVVPAVVFHEARAGDQFVEGPSGLDGDQRVVPTVQHERRHRQLLEAFFVGLELGGGPRSRFARRVRPTSSWRRRGLHAIRAGVASMAPLKYFSWWRTRRDN